jgi:hypothetical protein
MARSHSGSTDDESDSAGTFKRFTERYSEEELATLLIAAGAVMLFIPGINVIGIAAVVLGVIVWFTDWLWG